MGEDSNFDYGDDEDYDGIGEMNGKNNDDLADEEIPTIKLNTGAKPPFFSRIREFTKFHWMSLEDEVKNFLSTMNFYARSLYKNEGELQGGPWNSWRSRIQPMVTALNNRLRKVGYAARINLPKDNKLQCNPSPAAIAAATINDINAVFAVFDNSWNWGRLANEHASNWLNDFGEYYQYDSLKNALEKKSKGTSSLLGRKRGRFPISTPDSNDLDDLKNDIKEQIKKEMDDAKKEKKFSESEPPLGNTKKSTKTKPNEISVADKAFLQNNVDALKKLKNFIKLSQDKGKITGTYGQRWNGFITGHLDRYIKETEAITKLLDSLGI